MQRAKPLSAAMITVIENRVFNVLFICTGNSAHERVRGRHYASPLLRSDVTDNSQ